MAARGENRLPVFTEVTQEPLVIRAGDDAERSDEWSSAIDHRNGPRGSAPARRTLFAVEGSALRIPATASGLVGRGGAGKTTTMRILAGEGRTPAR